MKVFIKPSGVKVSVNQNSEAYARSIGWVEEGAEAPKSEPVQVKRGRPSKQKV